MVNKVCSFCGEPWQSINFALKNGNVFSDSRICSTCGFMFQEEKKIDEKKEVFLLVSCSELGPMMAVGLYDGRRKAVAVAENNKLIHPANTYLVLRCEFV